MKNIKSILLVFCISIFALLAILNFCGMMPYNILKDDVAEICKSYCSPSKLMCFVNLVMAVIGFIFANKKLIKTT